MRACFCTRSLKCMCACVWVWPHEAAMLQHPCFAQKKVRPAAQRGGACGTHALLQLRTSTKWHAEGARGAQEQQGPTQRPAPVRDARRGRGGAAKGGGSGHAAAAAAAAGGGAAEEEEGKAWVVGRRPWQETKRRGKRQEGGTSWLWGLWRAGFGDTPSIIRVRTGAPQVVHAAPWHGAHAALVQGLNSARALSPEGGD